MGRFVCKYQILGEGEFKILFDVADTTEVTSGVRNAALWAIGAVVPSGRDFIIIEIKANDMSPLNG